MAAGDGHFRDDRYHDEWVVDQATGRVVRRQAVSLAKKVAEKLHDAFEEGAIVLEPEEADVRAVVPATPPEELAEPLPLRQKRPPEAHGQPAIRDLNRERLQR
jgi:hypothetical protein